MACGACVLVSHCDTLFMFIKLLLVIDVLLLYEVHKTFCDLLFHTHDKIINKKALRCNPTQHIVTIIILCTAYGKP